MSSEILFSTVSNWLVDQALDDPDIVELFGNTCERLRGIGVALGRAMVNWTTLHPLYAAEMLVWRPGEAVQHDQLPFRGGEEPSQAWLTSPIRHLIESDSELLRRRLTGPQALLDFPLLHDFVARGYTDYLTIATDLSLPGPRVSTGLGTGKRGMVTSFTCTRESGFSDAEIDGLRRVNKRFALACKSAIQSRILRTLATTYLGRRAGERVLSGQIRRGDGETIPAVIWYSDLRDSTQFSAHLPQEAYIGLLNAYFECTAAAVLAEGGDVLDFIGDAVIAIFPVTPEREHEACERACRAVREALARLARLNATRQESGLEPIDIGIGLNEGVLSFGNIGTADRLAFSIVGSSVNEVARVEAMTKSLGVRVLATGTIARHDPAAWQEVGEHVLRGFDAPVPLFTPVSGASASHRHRVDTPDSLSA